MRPASTATSRLRSSLTKVPDLKKIAAFSRTEAVRDSRPPFFLYPALLCCKILTVICGVEKMDARKKLSDVLGELNRVTGLSLRADEVPEEDAAEAAGRIASLVAAYRERYDKTAFVRRLLKGNIAEEDLYSYTSRFHIADGGRRRVYVIECDAQGRSDAARVIRSMYVTRSGDLFTETDDTKMALIKSEQERDTEESALSLAHTIVDMLNTEVMLRARVGFGMTAARLTELPEAYRQACLSLEIGSVFYGGENVLSYGGLGIGRLIHDLPEESCRLYLKEVFEGGGPEDLDEETVGIINAFFDNNLNISETARSLYVHRNTLVYRLEKLCAQTGLDLRVFDDALKLKLAMMISDRLEAEQSGVFM